MVMQDGVQSAWLGCRTPDNVSFTLKLEKKVADVRGNVYFCFIILFEY